MLRLRLRFDLCTDVVMSLRAATLGPHETLGYITGSALLGAVANQLWDDMGDARAFELFESGRVRFGNALPAGPEGNRTLPMPRSLHRAKGSRSLEHLNLAVAGRPQGEQQVQARDGFICSSAPAGCFRRIRPRTRFVLRTAVGEGGRARDGFLYGCDAIEAGQRFVGWLVAEQEDELQVVRPYLEGRTLRLGRSRSAEFALVRVDAEGPLEHAGALVKEGPLWRILEGPAASQRVIALCVSDLALLCERTGGPRLLPDPGDFGLDRGHAGWELDLERSFLRFRSWSPWNGTRRRPDIERQCIEAGSVIVFRPAKGAQYSVDQVERARQCTLTGVGLWRSQGLGEVLVDPAVLHTDRLEIELAERGEDLRTARGPAARLPEDELGRWLEEQHEGSAARRRLEAAVTKAEAAMKRYGEIGPSQWGEVERLASTIDSATILDELERHVGKQRGARAGRGWSRRVRGKSAAECLRELVERIDQGERPFFVRMLAGRCAAAERRQRAGSAESRRRS